MKKVLFGILFLVAMVVVFIIYEEASFCPLKQDDFQKLFKEFNGSFRKSCSKDFIGFSIHGEIFDIYHYKIKATVAIDTNFPKITKWEGKEIIDDFVVEKWKNCPLDSKTKKSLYILEVSNFDNVKCCNSFKKELSNCQNYYSYVHFSEGEQYFLLYCTDSQELYYVRKRGL